MLEEESKEESDSNVNIIKKINSLDELVYRINKIPIDKLPEYSIGVFEVTNGGGSNRNLKWKIDEALRGEKVMDYLIKENKDFSKLNHYYAIVFVLRDFNEIQKSLLNFGFKVVQVDHDKDYKYKNLVGTNNIYQLKRFLREEDINKKKPKNNRGVIKDYNRKLSRLNDILFLPYYKLYLLVDCFTEPRRKYSEIENLWLGLLNTILSKKVDVKDSKVKKNKIVRTFIQGGIIYLLRRFDSMEYNTVNIGLESVTVSELISLLFPKKRTVKKKYHPIVDNLLDKLRENHIKSFSPKKEGHVAIMSNLIFESLSGIKGKIAEEYFERLLLSKLIESPEYNGKDDSNVLFYIPNLPRNLNYHLRGEIDLIVFAKKEALSRAINDIKKEYNPFLF